MTAITLYQAMVDKQRAIELCIDEDGVLDLDRFDAIEGTLRERALATTAVIKGLGHQQRALLASRDAVKAEYDREIARTQKSAEKLRDRLEMAMRETGVMSIQSDDGMLSAKLYLDRDESVEIDALASFPASLCLAPKEPAPDKAKIKAAILGGEPVAGARIVRKDRLTIK